MLEFVNQLLYISAHACVILYCVMQLFQLFYINIIIIIMCIIIMCIVIIIIIIIIIIIMIACTCAYTIISIIC